MEFLQNVGAGFLQFFGGFTRIVIWFITAVLIPAIFYVAAIKNDIKNIGDLAFQNQSRIQSIEQKQETAEDNNYKIFGEIRGTLGEIRGELRRIK